MSPDRRFLIQHPPAPGEKVHLTGAEARHARDVLRLTPGREVILIDGQGGEYPAVILAVDRRGVELRVEAVRDSARDPSLPIDLGLAMIRPERMELVVGKGTELGLASLTPIRCSRSSVKLPPEKMNRKIERWREISRQALKQCRRATPVTVKPETGFSEFVEQASVEQDSGAGLKLILQPGVESNKSKKALQNPPSRVTLLVGPEGGFTPEEVSTAHECGFVSFPLGPRILRSETAALAALAILGFELGDLS